MSAPDAALSPDALGRVGVGKESTISADASSVRDEVVPVDEARPLALDTARLLGS
jgi:hypothetical protein